MRLLLLTDPFAEAASAPNKDRFAVDFATELNLFDKTFAERYLRHGAKGRYLQPESHNQVQVGDLYYIGTRDVAGLRDACRKLPHCRMLTSLDKNWTAAEAPLYLRDGLSAAFAAGIAGQTCKAGIPSLGRAGGKPGLDKSGF